MTNNNNNDEDDLIMQEAVRARKAYMERLRAEDPYFSKKDSSSRKVLNSKSIKTENLNYAMRKKKTKQLH
jgi:hypothetical protein